MLNNFVRKTNKEDFDSTVSYTEPRIPGKFDEKTLIPGDIVSLWWLDGYYKGKYIPKYFKRIYQIDIPKQLDIYLQMNLLNKPVFSKGQERYSITEGARELISQYFYIIEAHKKGANDIFNESRRKLASQEIVLGNEMPILEKISIPKDLIPNEFIAIDIETTGLNKKFDDVIQLTATYWKQGKEVSNFNTYICPKAKDSTLYFRMMN